MKTIVIVGFMGCVLLGAAATALHSQAKETPACALPSPGAREDVPMTFKIVKTDEEWKKLLSPEEYRVMREGATERPFEGKYNDYWAAGIYVCPGCGTELFRSGAKYDHGTGWPSFTAPVDRSKLLFIEDHSYGMHRTEVRCAACGAHLGHLFDDGPAPGGAHYCINSASLRFVPASEEATLSAPALKKAVFAAGCFWGVEYKFAQIKGVVKTTAGYTGGHTSSPTYKDVCSDTTGHAEAVEIEYDPARIGYEDLLDAFFKMHDPTTLNRQGPDFGNQYRSVVFFGDDEQKEMARKKIAELNTSGRYRNTVVTQVVPFKEFWPAEEYHQKYFQKRGGGAACGL